MQFDVHPNPIRTTRAAYPYLVVLQADVAHAFREQLVAPLAPRTALQQAKGRLTPIATFDSQSYVVMVPRLTSIPARDLGRPVGTLSPTRGELLAAIDYLFFGV